MPVHDWTRVSAGTFHDFHNTWIVELKRILNGGLLPSGYYAQSEQVAGEAIPDVLTLRTGETPGPQDPFERLEGATAVAEAPPHVSHTSRADEADVYALKRRTLVIRHASGDEIVALIEILSPGNKNSHWALERFVQKAVSALTSGYHLLAIDLFRPGRFDPEGIHAAIWSAFSTTPYEAPADRPLNLAAYCAGAVPEAYVEPVAIGSPLPEMPLFLAEGWYVNVPLERTYEDAYATVPERWRRVIERESASA